MKNEESRVGARERVYKRIGAPEMPAEMLLLSCPSWAMTRILGGERRDGHPMAVVKHVSTT